MKKQFCMLLAAAMLITAAGCNKTTNQTGSGANVTLEGELVSENPIELSVFYHTRDSFVFDNEWPVFQKAAELTNVTLKSVVPKTTTSSTEAFNLMMAGGELADLVFAQQIYIQKYAAEGAFIALNDLIDEYAPNIKHELETNEIFRKAVTSEDGNIYYIVQAQKLPEDSSITATTNNIYYIRQDWLDKLGLPIPDTFDEYVETLRAFRDGDPNGNGKKDEVPFFAGSYEEFVRMAVNSTGARTNWYVDDEGKVHLGQYERGYKEGIKTAAQWYSEGLVDQEIFTRGSSARDILLGNNLGGALRGAVDSTAEYNNKYAGQIEGFKLVPMLPPKNVNGERIEETSTVVGTAGNIGGFAISYQNEYAVETIKYLDFWFGETGSRLAEFGIEGEQYDIIDGKPTLRDELLNGDETTISQLRAIGAQQLMPFLDTREARLQWTDEIALEGTSMYEQDGCLCDPFPTLNFTVGESETIDAMLGSIVTYMNEMQQKWILGESDVEADFDNYLEKMKAMGMDDCLAAYQSAYDRYVTR